MKYTTYAHGAVVREMNDLASFVLGETIPGHRESQQHKLRNLNDLSAHYDDYRNRILREERRLGRKLTQPERLAIIAKSTAYANTPKKKKSQKVVPKPPRKKATDRLRARQQRTANVLNNDAAVRRHLRFEAATKRLGKDTIDRVLAALEKRS